MAKRLDLDRWGVWAGTACAIHCVIVGLLLGLLPVLGLSFLANPITEFLFFAIALIVGPLAMIKGYRHHHSAWPSVSFAVGFGLILGAHLVFGHDHQAQFSVANLISAVGGVILVTGHVINARLMHGHHCSPSCQLTSHASDPAHDHAKI